jgi:sporulation protein YlmC with PRC-barrel domain
MTSSRRAWGILIAVALLAGAIAVLVPRGREKATPAPAVSSTSSPVVASRMGKDPGPLLARREGVLKELEGRIGYNSRAYGTTLAEGGIEFSTGIAFKGLGQPRLTYAMEELRAGDTVLAKGGSVRPRVDGRSIAFDRGTVTERYLFEKEALEQIFVVASLPEERGEIKVSGRVTTNLAPPAEGTSAGKLSFTWRGVELLSVSKAVAIDAEGKRLPLELAWADGRMSMTVPAGWVQEARLPIVIDPLIGGPIQVDNQLTNFVDQVNSLFVRISDCAWNGSEWLVVWDEQFGGSAFDYNVLGQRVSASGSAVGSEIQIGVTTGGDYEPTISFSAAQNRYLVAWRHDPANDASDADQRIEGRVIDADGTLLTGAFTIDDPAGQDFAPSVAQDGTNWFVVWTNALADTNIKGRFVSAAGVPGTSADPDTDADAAARPSLDFLGSTYAIAWEKGAVGSRSIAARTMDATGAFGTSITTVSQSANDADHADVSSGTGQFLIVWEEKPTGSSFDILGRRADATLAFNGSAFSINTGATDQLTPRAAYSATSDLWYVVYADPVTGNQDIYGVRVTGAGTVFAPDRLTNDGVVDRRPEITWASSSNEMLVTYLFKTNDPYQLRARRVSMDFEAPTTPGQPVGTPNPNNTGSHLVTWTASTDPGGIANYQLERSFNAGAFALVASPATNSFQENALPEGSYVYRVRAVDNIGNLSAYSPNSAPVIVDQTAPTAASLAQYESDGTTPIPVGGTATSSTVVLKASISDSATSVKLQVEVKLVGTGFDGTGLTESAFQANGLASVTLGSLANGSYHWQARAVDQAGNPGAFVSFGGNAESEADFVVGNQTPPAKPVITTASQTTNDNTPDINGTSDPSVTITVFITQGAVTVQTLNTTSTPTGTWGVTAAPLADGTYTVKARATNAAGDSPDSDPITIIVDTGAPGIASVTSTTANGTYSVGALINITVNFTEPVTLAGGNLQVALDTGAVVSIAPFGPASSASGTYTVAGGQNSFDLTAVSPLTLQAGATLRDAAGNNSGLAIPAGQNLGDLKDLVIDTTAPSVTSVTSTTANGTYGVGASINIIVNFSEPVTLLNGNLQVALDTGAIVSIAPFGPSTTASGTYVVAAGHTSADLTASSPLTLQGGATLRDGAGNGASLAIPAGQNLGDLKNLVIDGTAPAVSSVTSTTANGTYGTGASINVTVNFSEPVTLVGGNLQVLLDTGATVSIAPFGPATSASGTYTVAAGQNSADLTASSPLTLQAGATLRDAAGNNATMAIPAGQNLGDLKDIVIDTGTPAVTSVTSTTANGTYGVGAAINITVNFSKPVTLSGGNLQVALDTGATVSIPPFGPATSASGTYTVAAGQTSADLTAVSPLTLQAGATLRDAAMNDAILAIPAGQNLGDLKNIVIDTGAPTIASVTSTTANGTYGVGASINITVNFSEPVTLAGGNLQVALDTGATVSIPPFGPASSASGTYTVAAGQNSADLTATSPLTLQAGATLRDSGGSDAVLSIPAGQNLGDLKNIVIDTVAAAVTSVTSTNANGTYGAGASINITVNFSEPVTLTGGNLQVTLDTGAVVAIAPFGPATTASGTYVVAAGHNSPDLTAVSPLTLQAGAALVDSAGNAAVLAIPAGQNLGDLKNIVVGTPPPPPTNLTAVAGNNRVDLSWTAPSGGANAYNVFRTSNPTATPSQFDVLATGVATTTYADLTAVNGTTYRYYVTALNGSGESVPSNIVTATPQAPGTPPAAPTNLRVTTYFDCIDVDWDEVPGVAGYNVYRRPVGDTTWIKLNTAGLVRKSKFRDSRTLDPQNGPAAGVNYSYRVTAVAP